MLIEYRKLHNELFNKIYIYNNATDKDKEIYEKLTEWLDVEYGFEVEGEIDE